MNKVWVYDHVDNKVDEMNLEKFRFERDEYGDDEGWPIFTIQKGKERLDLVLSRDPEGNGGGFAFIEDAPVPN